MTIYKLNDYNDGNADSDLLGIFESKLTKEQIKKIVKITALIYSKETCDDHKTTIFEQLIKKGSYWNGYKFTNNHDVDKKFKWIKVKEIEF